jgi:hypothetical protein
MLFDALMLFSPFMFICRERAFSGYRTFFCSFPKID